MKHFLLALFLMATPFGIANAEKVQFSVLPQTVQTEYSALCSLREERPTVDLSVQKYALPMGDNFQNEQNGKVRHIIIIPCYAAAYNFGSVIFIENKYNDSWSLLTVPSMTSKGYWITDSVLSGADYDSHSAILSSNHKHRGLGDCYTAGEYKWDAEVGTFYVNHFVIKDKCDGQVGLDNETLTYQYKKVHQK